MHLFIFNRRIKLRKLNKIKSHKSKDCHFCKMFFRNLISFQALTAWTISFNFSEYYKKYHSNLENNGFMASFENV